MAYLMPMNKIESANHGNTKQVSNNFKRPSEITSRKFPTTSSHNDSTPAKKYRIDHVLGGYWLTIQDVPRMVFHMATTNRVPKVPSISYTTFRATQD